MDMSHAFDEIRKHVKRQEDEQRRQSHFKQLQVQGYHAAVIRFAQVVSQYSDVVNQTLEEFAAACMGVSRSLTVAEKEQWHFTPLQAFGLSAGAGVLSFSIEIKGDMEGNIGSFAIGRQHSWQDEWGSDNTRFIVDTQLPRTASKKDLETALVKSYMISRQSRTL